MHGCIPASSRQDKKNYPLANLSVNSHNGALLMSKPILNEAFGDAPGYDKPDVVNEPHLPLIL